MGEKEKEKKKKMDGSKRGMGGKSGVEANRDSVGKGVYSYAAM